MCVSQGCHTSYANILLKLDLYSACHNENLERPVCSLEMSKDTNM